MKKPLLLNLDHLQEEEKVLSDGKNVSKSRDMTPKRFTPMNMAKSQLSGGQKSKGNALKAAKFDKFNSGMKDQLIKDNKE